MGRPFGSGRKSLTERFWGKVDKRDANECWLWIGFTLKPRGSGWGNYGCINSGGKGRPLLAHRVSWEIANGPVPDGMLVCHHCDNPPCVNPRHLFLGTQSDNMNDCSAKGRVRSPKSRGETHPMAKLTKAKVLLIRAARGEKSARELALRLGVCRNSIHNIWSGRTWSSV
jgi:HNH endonuclease